jgi:broad specificity phosphatase PhoE
MTRLLALRHGATDWNALGLIQGRADRPLSEAGRAAICAMRLPPDWQDADCFSSPLMRAMETARLLGLVPQPEPALIEMSWGTWEGKSLDALRAELGDEMAENEDRGLDFRPAGGESPRDVQMRLRPFLARLRAPAIAVTHKGVLRALYAAATGWTMTDDPPDKLNMSCAHGFEILPGGEPRIEALNLPLRRT